MAVTNERFEVAKDDFDCNASEHIKEIIDEIKPELTHEELEAVERAKANGWKVLKGERCRVYTWNEGGDEEYECVEIPAIAEICSRLDLWTEN